MRDEELAFLGRTWCSANLAILFHSFYDFDQRIVFNRP